ncbi:hypothetical protein V1477_012089 [Vespula maculifrons]|uniref:Uncharacterized protein n=1 Tax=Vespula maculifrons TaxID=7453 RepID=A0ABD2BY25_VESMC
MKTVAGLGEGWKGCRYGPALAEGAVPKGADAIPRCWRFLEAIQISMQEGKVILKDNEIRSKDNAQLSTCASIPRHIHRSLVAN